jgi:hypothetical protein
MPAKPLSPKVGRNALPVRLGEEVQALLRQQLICQPPTGCAGLASLTE